MDIGKVREICEEVFWEKYKLLDIEYLVENNHNYLKITIDTVSLDDCVNATKLVSSLIDKANLTNDKYFLEVGSKGEERK